MVYKKWWNVQTPTFLHEIDFSAVHNNITQLQEIVSTIFTFMECRDLIL